MWSVPSGVRPFAIATSVVVMHVLGDVPAPPLLGLLQSRLQNWRLSMCLLSSLLVVAAAAYALGGLTSRSAPDYRQLPLADHHPASSGSLTAAAAAAMVVDVEEEEGGGAGATSVRVSPERPLLARHASGLSAPLGP